MKRIFLVLSVFIFMFVCVACKDGETDKELTLYSSTSETNLQILLPEFEKATGIKVNYIYDSTGNIVTRIKNEAGNPQADVVWLPEANILADTQYYEKYVSPHNDLYEDAFKNVTGYATNVNYAIPVLIYNKTMVSNPITGYSSLLRTELKGKIAFGDATSSSSAYNHLENMILAMGEGANNDEKVASYAAWEYVEAFLNNLDKKIITSSNVTLTGVVNGEYAVGLSWDTKGYEAIKAKLEGDTAYADIEVVYMSEGIVAKNSSVAIIKGTKKLDLAKKFVDWMSSQAGQDVIGEKLEGAHPILSTAKLADYKKSDTPLTYIAITTEWSSNKKQEILNKYTQIYQRIFA